MNEQRESLADRAGQSPGGDAMKRHAHEYGPIFVHGETEKRRCLLCGFAVPVTLVPPELIRMPTEQLRRCAVILAAHGRPGLATALRTAAARRVGDLDAEWQAGHEIRQEGTR
ncbi:MAG: hypothetical protein A3J75_00135 [Acidobacteria bacterium RBG_16_68_9]|nr:MAG: hypothetical protein A3J75_00135 [Acidobacteria bacterium RBG_16_68_9]